MAGCACAGVDVGRLHRQSLAAQRRHPGLRRLRPVQRSRPQRRARAQRARGGEGRLCQQGIPLPAGETTGGAGHAMMAPGKADGPTMLQRAKEWARVIKRDVVALWIAARDPRVPWYAKALAMAVAAYPLSPLDLIPDFIPVLGYLDDLVIVPLGILLVVALIPAPLMAEFRAQAATLAAKPRSTTAAVVIVLIWIAATILVGWWFWRWWTS